MPRLFNLRELSVLFLAAVILFGQLENEILYSVDGVIYAVVGQELNDRPFWQWALMTWKGAPFYEHPPLTPWLLAAAFRLFGETAMSAVFVPVFLSWATVAMTLLIGRRLYGEGMGLLAALVFALTPQFIKAGRNPMLEPALQAFITLSVLLLVRARQEKSLGSFFGSGIALGLALLAKGPPGLLALGMAVFLSFQLGSLERKKEIKAWSLYAFGALLPVALFDLWHASLGKGSFWAIYFGNQLHLAVVQGRGRELELTPYLRILFIEFQPWIAFVLAAVPIQLWRKDKSRRLVWLTGWAWVLGTLIPFTLMRQKSPWYIHIYYPGLSLITASLIHHLMGDGRALKWAPRIAMGLALPVVLLSSAIPTSMQSNRPGDRFMGRAKLALGRSLEGAAIADCMGIGAWRGPFMYRFYFRAESRDCGDTSARYQIEQVTKYQPQTGHKIIYVGHPWVLVDRRPD